MNTNVGLVCKRGGFLDNDLKRGHHKKTGLEPVFFNLKNK